MLGISVYLSQPVAAQEPYIRKMKEHGFDSIFTSLHIPEDNPARYRDELKALGKIAKELDMELVPDISPNSLKHLGCTWENADSLLNWGLSGLRVDYGVEPEIIALLSQKMKVALNASTLTREEITALKKCGLNTSSVEAWHNFYPRPETGLDRESFREKNRLLKEEGITVMAFVPGDETRRGPLFEGLPTLEDHRHFSPFTAYLDLKENEEIDKILIGDPELSEGALRQFSSYRDETFYLRARSFTSDQHLLETLSATQSNRQDRARDVIRSMESRMYALIGTKSVPPLNTVERPTGSITIDNERYGRYQGEVQITKKDLTADDKVNVVGRVIEEDLPLLPFIKGGCRFMLRWV
ncbi:DUF871 domain-containing protein [Neobacillus notoginsengisoli]|uniref:DUF871 domain-containing protein n=2 Tax=Neobacillus notoginsengisoli TaxID=1578198 RepID=A0A417YZC0_9BACI|nr:MupG family TIM beta-alpha barrel fold protein [Neobacillus notoginsengisoli]RHW43146.1 DUF871 domain-containing protein [Neobacillus notoginsengisoli]